MRPIKRKMEMGSHLASICFTVPVIWLIFSSKREMVSLFCLELASELCRGNVWMFMTKRCRYPFEHSLRKSTAIFLGDQHNCSLTASPATCGVAVGWWRGGPQAAAGAPSGRPASHICPSPASSWTSPSPVSSQSAPPAPSPHPAAVKYRNSHKLFLGILNTCRPTSINKLRTLKVHFSRQKVWKQTNRSNVSSLSCLRVSPSACPSEDESLLTAWERQ